MCSTVRGEQPPPKGRGLAWDVEMSVSKALGQPWEYIPKAIQRTDESEKQKAILYTEG
jgi:hypothetical protein